MISKYCTWAVHFPDLLIKEITFNLLPDNELADAVSTLALLADKQEALFHIGKQLWSKSDNVVDSAIFATRVVYAEKPDYNFPHRIREGLVNIAVAHLNDKLRIEAAEALADYKFQTA